MPKENQPTRVRITLGDSVNVNCLEPTQLGTELCLKFENIVKKNPFLLREKIGRAHV